MTGKERITAILNHEPVDRIGFFEHFWNDTKKLWEKQGYVTESENLADHFGFDMEIYWAFDLTADLDFTDEVLEETEETILIKDGNGAILRRNKLHEATPEHVDFTVKDRQGWEEYIKPFLLEVDDRRINFKEYRKAKESAKKAGRFFCLSGINVFEAIHPVCGHEHMLMGMGLDPDWVKDMVKVYSELIVRLQKRLFEVEGYPDGIWYYEDMGFKQRPFMSPAMYKKIVWPGHKYTIDYAHSLGLKVIMHSCGYIEPLLSDMIEAGIDCLQVIEVKAGMNLLKLYEKYSDKIAFMGGIDVRKLYTNDRAVIDKELESKIPELIKKYSYILHSDHSIPVTVDYGTYRYFAKKGLKIGRYNI